MRSYLFRSFHRFYRLNRWTRACISSGGRLVLAGLVAGAVFGVDIRKSLAYQIFALCAGLSMAAIIGYWLTRGRFSARRDLPRFATVGEPVTYSLQLVNAGKRYGRGLRLREVPVVDFPTFDEFSALREPGYAKRNRFDRYVGYPRWIWVVRLCEGLTTDEYLVPEVAPSKSVRVEGRFVPRRRGAIRFSAVDVLVPEPLGLLRKTVRVPLSDSVLVLPKSYPMPALQVARGRRHRMAGIPDRRTFGGADDFKGVREYRPGDSVRHIDWRASARLGEPMVKEFHDEHVGGLTVILETNALRYSESFEAAVSATASILAAAPIGDPPELMFVREGASNAAHGSDAPRHGEVVRAKGREPGFNALAAVQATGVALAEQADALLQNTALDAVIVVLGGDTQEHEGFLERIRRRAEGEVLAVVVSDATPRAALPAVYVRPEHLAVDLRSLGERFATREAA